MQKQSDLLDLTMADLYDLLLQLLEPLGRKIVGAFVLLGQPVRIAEYEPTFTLDTKQSQFLAAVIAPLAIFLFLLGNHMLDGQALLVFGLDQQGFRSLGWSSERFFLFLNFLFSKLDASVLMAAGAKPLVRLVPEEHHAALAQSVFGLLQLCSLDAHCFYLYLQIRIRWNQHTIYILRIFKNYQKIPNHLPTHQPIYQSKHPKKKKLAKTSKSLLMNIQNHNPNSHRAQLQQYIPTYQALMPEPQPQTASPCPPDQPPMLAFLNYTNKQTGDTALHECVKKKDMVTINKYLGLLRDHRLQRQEQMAVSAELMQYRVRVWINMENREGMTAIHYAAKWGYYEIAEILENVGAKLDKVTLKEETVLHIACQTGKLQSLIHFRGKVDTNAVDCEGRTALHQAAKVGNFEIVRFLIAEERIELDSRDKMGRTALMYAVEYAPAATSADIVKALLIAGSNRFIRDRLNKKNALDLAKQKNLHIIYKYLTEVEAFFCHKNFLFHPKPRGDSQWIILFFSFLSAIILLNLLVSLTKESQSSGFNKHFISQIAYLYQLIGQVLIAVVSLVLSLVIHCSRKSLKTTNLYTLKQNPEQAEQYCFECEVIQQEETLHCHECGQCIDMMLEHSFFLGRCIGRDNLKKYLGLLLLVLLLMLSEILRAVFIIFGLAEKGIRNFGSWQILMSIVCCVDFICLVPWIVTIKYILITLRRRLQLSRARQNQQTKSVKKNYADSICNQRFASVKSSENRFSPVKYSKQPAKNLLTVALLERQQVQL